MHVEAGYPDRKRRVRAVAGSGRCHYGFLHHYAGICLAYWHAVLVDGIVYIPPLESDLVVGSILHRACLDSTTLHFRVYILYVPAAIISAPSI